MVEATFNWFLFYFLIILNLNNNLLKNLKKSWDYNYRAASQSLYNSDTLITDPDQGLLKSTSII